MRAKMLERWIALLKRLGINEITAQETYHMLVYYYMQPHRHYHTLAHISSGLKELDYAKSLAVKPDELELAWWLHDAIYETWAKDNEHQSAGLAKFFITKLMNLPLSTIGIRVYHLILPTQHRCNPNILFGDTRLMVDIDLHELGKPPTEFNKNSTNLRREYWWMSEQEYRRNGIDFLEHFLKRTDIYLTPYFREKYEIQARENIKAEIEKLRTTAL